MNRKDIFEQVESERAYQDGKWGRDFDDANTPNDWIAYLIIYAARAVCIPWNKAKFREGILKVMTICCAILEQDNYAPRHYDVPGSPTFKS